MNLQVQEDISNHVMIVTGAGSGIGRAIASLLVAKGAVVAACDKNLESLEDLKNEIQNPNLYVYSIDFLSEDSINNCVKKVEQELGGIQGAINCVGILGENGTKAEDVDIDNFDLVYKINLRGALIFTKSLLKGMSDRGYGRILHLASISGKDGNPLLISYSATKAGMIGMVKSIGKEYATSGITINAMAPALIETPILEGFSESTLAFLKSKIPMNRFGKVSEVALLAAWIVSPACSFTTGFTFDLSGGRAVY
jgi:3-oxoacyl-[acyl-carrier protein] reductase